MSRIMIPLNYSGAPQKSGLSYPTIILKDNPVAYWPLNETSGTVVHDLSGNGNTLSINGFTLAQPAIAPGLGVCMVSNSLSSNLTPISSLTNIPINNSPYTLEAWISSQYDVSQYSNLGAMILGYGNFYSENQVNALKCFANASNSANGVTNFWWSDDYGPDYDCQANTVYHIVATYNQSQRSIYVNGILLGSEASSGMGCPTSNNFSIGYVSANDFTQSGILGSYSNIAIYDHALTAAQIQNHYNAGINA